MKMILGIVVIVLCTCFGYVLSLKYRKRHKYYADFSDFNIALKKEVSFSQHTICELIDIKTSNNESDFYLLLNNVISGKNFEISLKYLSENERRFFFSYCKNIGSLDKLSQLDYLETVQKDIDDGKEKSDKDEKKYCALCIKLGFLIGLIFFIIII